jgi:hypothetical protein
MGLIPNFVCDSLPRNHQENPMPQPIIPDDAAVRRRLAGGLFNTLNDAKAEDDLARRDALLDELRALARAFPDDAAAR